MRTRIWLLSSVAMALALTSCSTQPSADDAAHRDLARAASELRDGMAELSKSYDTAELAVAAVKAGETSFGSTLIGQEGQTPRAQRGAIVYAVKFQSDEIEIKAILQGIGVTSDWTGEDRSQVYICVVATQATGADQVKVEETDCPDDVVSVTAGGAASTKAASIDDLGFERP
ncbi:MAG TPA: hypothetical protein VNJ54_21510 [Plantibacter sp.]|uniref:hypothetical protein n=1 Tax=unclassified Plantibacter TaxID=2624265 RepID=UPI002BA8939C|nr:hypothetical protein [Plantibacter sp.]